MAAGDITHAEVVGVFLTATYALQYTVPASRVVIGMEIVMHNTNTNTTYYPSVQLVANGQNTNDKYKIIGPQSAAGNGLLGGESRGDSYNPMAAAGSTIWAKADTTNVIAFRAGITLKEV